jgi:hypothetical protein
MAIVTLRRHPGGFRWSRCAARPRHYHGEDLPNLVFGDLVRLRHGKVIGEAVPVELTLQKGPWDRAACEAWRIRRRSCSYVGGCRKIEGGAPCVAFAFV